LVEVKAESFIQYYVQVIIYFNLGFLKRIPMWEEHGGQIDTQDHFVMSGLLFIRLFFFFFCKQSVKTQTYKLEKINCRLNGQGLSKTWGWA
jgi:hypothetical protein